MDEGANHDSNQGIELGSCLSAHPRFDGISLGPTGSPRNCSVVCVRFRRGGQPCCRIGDRQSMCAAEVFWECHPAEACSFELDFRKQFYPFGGCSMHHVHFRGVHLECGEFPLVNADHIMVRKRPSELFGRRASWRCVMEVPPPFRESPFERPLSFPAPIVGFSKHPLPPFRQCAFRCPSIYPPVIVRLGPLPRAVGPSLRWPL